jgi:capsular polysaccharide transport system permease protein
MLDLQRLIPGRLAERRGGPVAEQARAKGVALLKAGFPRPALPNPKIPPILKAPSTRRILQIALALLPTLLAVLYFGLIASDRYVSQAQFVIRTASKSAGTINFGSLLQMTGLGQSDDDTYAVQAYMTSRNAVQELSQKIPLKEIYDRTGADFISRYPSIFYGRTKEEFYKYFQWMLDVVHDGNTGITTLRVEAFTPQDAQLVAENLLQLGEKTVNRLNTRIEGDAVRVAQEEVDHQEQQLIDAQLAITNFRDRELMMDPVRSAVIMSGVIGKLDASQSEVEAEIREMETSSPLSPQLPGLRRKVAAIAGQIAKERDQIAGPSTGLADQLALYERLVLTREFTTKALTAATTALDSAKSEARRQQLYLERVVEPNLPDYPAQPERLRTIATVFAFNVIFLLVASTIITGVREHSASRH